MPAPPAPLQNLRWASASCRRAGTYTMPQRAHSARTLRCPSTMIICLLRLGAELWLAAPPVLRFPVAVAVAAAAASLSRGVGLSSGARRPAPVPGAGARPKSTSKALRAMERPSAAAEAAEDMAGNGRQRKPGEARPQTDTPGAGRGAAGEQMRGAVQATGPQAAAEGCWRGGLGRTRGGRGERAKGQQKKMRGKKKGRFAADFCRRAPSAVALAQPLRAPERL